MTFKETLINYRRELHQYPELSLKEFATTKRLKQWLQENDIFVYDLGFEPGIVAEIKGALPGPTIALRADIDALPIEEASGLPFASLNKGVAHCCGHDTHMTIILGAAILLQQKQEKLKGCIRIIFQPGEEDSFGAYWFLEKYPQMLEGVEAIFGCHNKPELPVGTIGIKAGPLMASVDKFEINIEGKGGHGGMPNNCLDPIVAGSQLVNTLQTIVSRRLGPLDNAVVSVTQFHAGNTWNVIPGSAYLEGTVRTFQKEARKNIPEYMQAACEGIGAATGTKIHFKWVPSIGAVNNAPQLIALMQHACTKLGLTAVEPTPLLAGDDFSAFQEKIPGVYVFLGSQGPYPWHHPAYTIDEDCLEVGAKYFAEVALEYLGA